VSTRLEQAFAEASKLPLAEQETFAEFLLWELEDDREWLSKFASSQDVLSQLASEAREAHQMGTIEPIEDLFK
jgi:hypothetical protein